MLGGLLRKLGEVVMRKPNGKCEIRYCEVGVLEIHDQLGDAPAALSPDTHRVWACKNSASKSSGNAGREGDDVVSAGIEDTTGGAARSSSASSSPDDEGSDESEDLISFSDDEDSLPKFTRCSTACE